MKRNSLPPHEIDRLRRLAQSLGVVGSLIESARSVPSLADTQAARSRFARAQRALAACAKSVEGRVDVTPTYARKVADGVADMIRATVRAATAHGVRPEDYLASAPFQRGCIAACAWLIACLADEPSMVPLQERAAWTELERALCEIVHIGGRKADRNLEADLGVTLGDDWAATIWDGVLITRRAA